MTAPPKKRAELKPDDPSRRGSARSVGRGGRARGVQPSLWPRAVRTKSRPSVSSIVERTIRAVAAAKTRPSDTDGSQHHVPQVVEGRFGKGDIPPRRWQPSPAATRKAESAKFPEKSSAATTRAVAKKPTRRNRPCAPRLSAAATPAGTATSRATQRLKKGEL